MAALVHGTFNQIPFWRLRARFRACGYYDGEVADALGISKNTLSARLRGVSAGGWTEKEICMICRMMEIPQEEIGDYFFPSVQANGGEGECVG